MLFPWHRLGQNHLRYTLLRSKKRLQKMWRNTITHSLKNGRRSLVSHGQMSGISLLTCNTEAPRIEVRITEGEAKRNKRDNLEFLLRQKINSVRYPMQELELNYPTTKGKVYSEEEDRYLLCRLFHYGMQAEDVYERIKKDITEFPVFRFDWFFKSRSPQELQRRCNTLLGMIEKEAELRHQEELATKKSASKGKVSPYTHSLSFLLTRLCRNEASRRCKRRTRRNHGPQLLQQGRLQKGRRRRKLEESPSIWPG